MTVSTSPRKSKAVLARWERALKRSEKALHPKVRDERLKLLKASKRRRFCIWLGGPCSQNPIYETRCLLRKWLRSHGYDVQFSERWGKNRDLVASELAEVEAFDFIVLLVVSMGTAAEAVEFAHLSGPVRGKLKVYCPSEHVRGYLYKTLSQRHRVTTTNELFKLRPTRNGNPMLALKIYEGVLAFQRELLRRQRTRREAALLGV